MYTSIAETDITIEDRFRRYRANKSFVDTWESAKNGKDVKVAKSDTLRPHQDGEIE